MRNTNTNELDWMTAFDEPTADEQKEIDAKRIIRESKEAAYTLAVETEKAKYKKCPKCSGKGKIQSFTHIGGGVCYKCKGYGKVKK
jgi:DnaJ-class molecular chaperone